MHMSSLPVRGFIGQPRRRLLCAASIAVAAIGACAGGEAATADTIRFLGDRDLAPYEFLDKGNPAGANVDLVQALAARMGVQAQVHLVAWDTAQAEVMAGRGDALTMLGRTPQRERQFLFTGPTVPVNFALFVRAEDARRFERQPLPPHLRVGVTPAGLAREALLDRFPGVNLVEMASIEAGIRMLLHRQVDAIAAQEWSTYFQLDRLGVTSVAGLAPFHSRYGNIAVRADNPQLLGRLDRALREIKENGELDRILDRWSTTRMRTVSESTISTAAVVGLAALLCLAALAASTLLLRRRKHELAREVEERRVAEQEMRRAKEQLERADRNKDRFLATLAHELRNPLAPISNAVTVLQRSAHEPQRVQWASEVLARQLTHLRSLVDDLTDIARVSTGQLVLQLRELSLQELARDAVEVVLPACDERRQRIAITAPEAPVLVRVDPRRMHQVVVNLLTNASRYTPPDGDIEVRIEVHAEGAVLRVRDTGIGMDAEVLAQIFDMFFRESAAAERAPEGLGLGLWLCHRLVSLHGGTLSAQSAGKGEGATFSIELPRKSGGPLP